MKSLLLVCFAFAMAVSAFQPLIHPNNGRTTVSCQGLFDGFINSMEAGYKGEDSAFQKQKAADAKKREEQKKRAEERKARGYTELKDVAGKKSFAKVKYEAEPEEASKDEKKFFGLF